MCRLQHYGKREQREKINKLDKLYVAWIPRECVSVSEGAGGELKIEIASSARWSWNKIYIYGSSSWSLSGPFCVGIRKVHTGTPDDVLKVDANSVRRFPNNWEHEASLHCNIQMKPKLWQKIRSLMVLGVWWCFFDIEIRCLFIFEPFSLQPRLT